MIKGVFKDFFKDFCGRGFTSTHRAGNNNTSRLHGLILNESLFFDNKEKVINNKKRSTNEKNHIYFLIFPNYPDILCRGSSTFVGTNY